MGRLKEIINFGLARSVLPVRLRTDRARKNVVVLMYHELSEADTDIEAWTVVRRSDFLRQMEYLDRNYRIVTLDQALQHVSSPRDSSRPLAVVTFDDGDRGNATLLLPLVQSLGIPVTVYVATGHVLDQSPYWFDQLVNAFQIDRPVTINLKKYGLGVYAVNHTRGTKNWQQIQALLSDLKMRAPEDRAQAVESVLADLAGFDRRKGSSIEPMSVEQVKALACSPHVTVGAHSHCHRILTSLGKVEAENSVKLSKTLLEQWTNAKVEHFAYPNGNCSDELMEIVAKTGFRSAVTTNPNLWQATHSSFAIPRIGIGRYDSLEQFKLNLVGGVRSFLPWRQNAMNAAQDASHACTP